MILSISCGRDDGELPIHDVRLESTCARGSHACYDACAVMVGMFFSYLVLFILSYTNWECKGSLFQFIYKIFLKFSRISLKLLHHFSTKTTCLVSKNGSEVQLEIGQTRTEPFLILNFAIAVEISSARSPPLR